MFRFQKEQEIVDIAGVKIGGQPGELPTVLAGTVFYPNHTIVKDEDKGTFDERKAESLINMQVTNAEETGNPCMVHIFASSKSSIKKYIDFVSEITEAPFLIDSIESSVRMEGIRYVTEIGLADRAINNSINMGITDDEKNTLKDSDVTASIVMGFNAMDSSLEGRIALLENGGSVAEKGLLQIAEDCGISKILIDPSVTPIGNGAGIALRMTLVAKAKWGHPVGSGIHNAPLSWDWLRNKKKEDVMVYKTCDIGSIGLQLIAAGDFVLYGPIESAPYAFPMAAMADIMIAEAAADFEIIPSEDHPINRLI
ncbi:MAG: tetrahydromethanopterin S-methyltransferase subunit H [Methanocellales archaeon]|nr:tetrahydromethanopterin S-methyltransferase subunit H [Methanocellales archaeon]